MANKQDYLAALRSAITRQHGCGSVHLGTEHVRESHGEAVWDGHVEVFKLMQHPKTNLAYAWAHLNEEKDDETRCVVVLELPPVKDARTAVRASMVADAKNGTSAP